MKPLTLSEKLASFFQMPLGDVLELSDILLVHGLWNKLLSILCFINASGELVLRDTIHHQ